MKTLKQAPGDSVKGKFNLKHAVAAGSERFHDSLDELDNEVRLAQAVLRRDLALIRAQRKEQEAAARQKEVEKARIPQQPIDDPASTPSPTPVKTEPTIPVKPEPSPEKEPTPKPPPPPPADADADVAMDNTDSLGGMQESEFDFDAVFGDSAMDTSADPGTEHADLNLDAGGDLDFTLDQQPSDELLRGLEDFAKNGTDDMTGQENTAALNLDDFNMPDMPDMSNLNEIAQLSQQQQHQPVTATATTAATKQEDPAPQQAATATTTNDELDLDAMTVDNLDDLFNLDDYENPEATQFDDAFIGFD